MKLISLVLAGALAIWMGAVGDAEAVTLEEGDIVAVLGGSQAILKIDPATGDRTMISCSDTTESICPVEVGAGPPLYGAFDVTISKNGGILVGVDLIEAGWDHHEASLVRVDPATGDRTIVSSAVIGSGPVMVDKPDGTAVMPAPDYFNIATLPPLAIAVAVGFLLGVSYMMGRRHQTRVS